MRRWRCLARSLVLAGLLGSALGASAASIALGLGVLPDPSGEVVRVGAWAVGIVLGFLAVVGGVVQLIVKPIITAQHVANREWLKEAIEKLGEKFVDVMAEHVASRDPHPTASHDMHEPLKRADEQLLKEIRIVRLRLARLAKAHNEAMKMERGVAACALTPNRAPHRATDPAEADFTKRVEVPPLEALLIPENGDDDDDADGDR